MPVTRKKNTRTAQVTRAKISLRVTRAIIRIILKKSEDLTCLTGSSDVSNHQTPTANHPPPTHPTPPPPPPPPPTPKKKKKKKKKQGHTDDTGKDMFKGHRGNY